MRASHTIFPAAAVGLLALGGWWVQRSSEEAETQPAVAVVVAANRETAGSVARSAAVVRADQPRDSLPDQVRRILTPEATRLRGDLGPVRVLVQRAIRELDGAERIGFLREVGDWAARHDVTWGLELAAGLEDFRARASLIGAMVETAVALDPIAAAAWVADVTEPGLRESAYQVVASKWAESDLAAARAWAGSVTEGAGRASAFEGVMWTWAQRDPKQAYEWAVGIAEPEVRGQMLVKLAKLLAVQDPQQALNWAVQFPEGPARDQALHYAIFQWAAKDLQAAAEWSAKLKDAGLQGGSDVAIARSWSNQEAQGATVWAAGIADPASRSIALATTLRKWAETSPAQAAAWLASRPAAPANEEIFRSVTNALATTHPDVTAGWLRGITDPTWRAAGEAILAERQQAVARKGGVPGS